MALFSNVELSSRRDLENAFAVGGLLYICSERLTCWMYLISYIHSNYHCKYEECDIVCVTLMCVNVFEFTAETVVIGSEVPNQAGQKPESGPANVLPNDVFASKRFSVNPSGIRIDHWSEVDSPCVQYVGHAISPGGGITSGASPVQLVHYTTIAWSESWTDIVISSKTWRLVTNH